MFQLIHGLAQPGIKSTVKLMTEKYVWSDIKKQVREWAKACIRCQKCKVSKHTKAKFGEFQQPDERTLKGAIKAHNNIKWTESLPAVLLGLRAAIRPDISYPIAQMVYGTSIKLPGELFESLLLAWIQKNFVAKLQQNMAELKPLKSPSNRKQNIFVH
ncbi:retrovirus-related Pol polyprotein from transposon opus [Trichonephila clavipes]|nr:retrovirus-related Pol polyprotein from transposon opus [Trichonephila clavipes]